MATVLIADDEQPVREFLAELVEASGHRAVKAANGREALEVIQAERPDLVLADLMMPLLGGAELCRRLKADPSTASIPVILFSSASRRPGVEGEGCADGFLAKPFDPEAIETLLRDWLRGR